MKPTTQSIESRLLLATWFLAGGLAAGPAIATDNEPEPLADNSFLIEEAYNQEVGVIQHIGLFSRDLSGDGWALSLTDEWPFRSQRHQISVGLQVQGASDDGSGGSEFGDTLVNYRYQVPIANPRLAFSPRVSAILPTGDERRGAGLGALGLQVNLPFSAELHPRWMAHTNLGATRVDGAGDGSSVEFDLQTVNAGQSLIFLATPRFNPMLEAVWTRERQTFRGGSLTTEEGFVALGVRWGYDFASGLQIVPGVAYARGFDDADGEEQWLLYLSFEHPFGR